MKAPILAILVAATTLGLGLSPASAARAHHKTGNQCVREQDPSCGTAAGPSYGFDMTYRRHFDRGYMVRPDYGYGSGMVIYPTMAPPESMASEFSDRCANISGKGTGVPAYLYGECKTRNGGF